MFVAPYRELSAAPYETEVRNRSRVPYSHGVTEFLTDAWIGALDDRISAAGAPPVAEQLVVQQEVERAPETVIYQVVLGPQGARVRSGTPETPTVVFSQSLAIATAIAQGRTTAHEAFMLGQLKVTGDTQALIAHTSASAWVAEQFAPVLTDTTY